MAEMVLRAGESLADDVVDAVRTGDVGRLERLFAEHPGLAAARLTPLDAAIRSEAGDVVRWLRDRGARTAAELGGC